MTENILLYIRSLSYEDKLFLLAKCKEKGTSLSALLTPTIKNIIEYIRRYGELPGIKISHIDGG